MRDGLEVVKSLMKRKQSTKKLNQDLNLQSTSPILKKKKSIYQRPEHNYCQELDGFMGVVVRLQMDFQNRVKTFEEVLMVDPLDDVNSRV